MKWREENVRFLLESDIWKRESSPYIRRNVLLPELFILCWLIGESVASIRFRLYFSEDGLTIHMNKTEETKYNEYMGFLNS